MELSSIARDDCDLARSRRFSDPPITRSPDVSPSTYLVSLLEGLGTLCGKLFLRLPWVFLTAER
jgi:hypothetical protein